MNTTLTIRCISKNGIKGLFSPLVQRGVKISAYNANYADVVIAGGGMVGTSLACALGCSTAFKNQSICLLEASPVTVKKEWTSVPFENRVSAITPGSKSFFKGIDVWNKISARRYHPFQHMHVWDSSSSGSISVDSKDVHEENVAYIIENSVIVESLLEATQESDNVQIKYETRINNVDFPVAEAGNSYTEDLVTVHLENGDKIQTKLLIGADGFNSFVRGSAQMQTCDYDYKQSAVVATLKISSKDTKNQTAWQRFLQNGPIALLPIDDNYSSLVWSTSKEHAKLLMNLSEDEFVESINNVIQSSHETNTLVDTIASYAKYLITTIQPGRYASNFLVSPPIVTELQDKSRGMFPLGLKHSTHYVKSRLALVGDAAHRIHPMAGQGVNLGFGDVKCLTQLLETAVDHGEDIGALETLLPYETERQRRVIPIISAINALNSLFSSTLTPVIIARGLGLQAADVMSPIKDRIVKYAMN